MKKTLLSLLLIITIIINNTTSAAILFVKMDATSGSNNGTSWQDAYTNLQSAIFASTSGDEIWVASGTYYPTTTTTRSATFYLKNGVKIYGGFSGTETSLSERDWDNNICILSGDIGTANNNSDNSYHVVTSNGVDPTAILDGFTIRDGNADVSGGTTHIGGGMYNYNASPTLSNLVITNNKALIGGGMYNYNSSPSISSVSFLSNEALEYGGGMYNEYYSAPDLSGVTFTSNFVWYYHGAGMYNTNSSPTLTNVTFTSNKTHSSWGEHGGGIYSENSTLVLTDVLFESNTTRERGGAMFNYNTNITLTNATFVSNSAKNGGGISNSYTNFSHNNYYQNIANAKFISNYASVDGGAIFTSSSSTNSSLYKARFNFVDIEFTSNSAGDDGGGMYNFGDINYTISNSLLKNNSSYNTGGGIYNYFYVISKIVNVVFEGNSSTNSGGGGLYNSFNSVAELINVVFYANSAKSASGGSAIINGSSSRIEINNGIFLNNISSTVKGESDSKTYIRNSTFYNNNTYAVYSLTTSDLHISNSIFYQNTNDIYDHYGNAIIRYCALQSSTLTANCPTCVTPANTDPLFADQNNAIGNDSLWGTNDDGLKLCSSSPLINLGDNSYVKVNYDITGEDRIQSSVVDLGAYEGGLKIVITNQPASVTFCANADTSFIVNVDGASAFQWQVNTGSGFVNLSNNSTYSGVATNTLEVTGATTAMNGYSYRCLLSGGCGLTVTSDSASLTVNSAPAQPSTISGNSSVCASTTNTYSISPVSGATGYTWAVPGGATINSGQGTPSISVIYGANSGSVSVTASNACGTSSAQTKAVTVNASPNNGVTQSGTTLTATETGATYQWLDCNNGNAPISGATSQSYTATANGSYAVEVTKNGCKATSTCTNISTVGIEAHAQTVFNIYPNPASNEITIELYQQGEYTLKIIDVTGKVVADFGKVYQNNQTYTIGHLSEGIYFIQVKTNNGVAIKKIVKQ
jgi:predicted outer membrane repeat protein